MDNCAVDLTREAEDAMYESGGFKNKNHKKVFQNEADLSFCIHNGKKNAWTYFKLIRHMEDENVEESKFEQMHRRTITAKRKRDY